MQNARLTFTDSNPSDWTWYSYVQDPALAEAVPAGNVEVTATYTAVSDIQPDHGYFVQSSGGTNRSVYVVAWIPIAYSAIQFLDEGDPCHEVTMKILANGGDMYYYTASGGLRRTLERQHTLTWNTLEWNETAVSYSVREMSSAFSNIAFNWSVESPLTDTRFTVTGDQFSRWFGSEESLQSDLYTAVAVKASAEAIVQLRTAENETGKSSGELSGSGPLEVQFFSHPSDAVRLIEWYIYKPGEESGSYTRYIDQDLTYTFKESGTYTVKLFVSNTTCMDSAEFKPQISESMLDCPNFFTPRSSPGENDEFRVAYRSLISFKGIIVNRWGNVLFEWTDPAMGWDGNYKGKAVSPGVYFYVIEAEGSDGILYKKSGDINLLE
jgi:gliding motility-associated-like protein